MALRSIAPVWPIWLVCALSCAAACSTTTPADEAPTSTPDTATPDASAPYDETEQAPLALGDLSILFPLPQANETERLWRATETGARGPLLPDTIELPALTLPEQHADRAAERAALRVVALRLDPCFQEGGAAAPCHPQIRLVLQPLEPGDGRARFTDSAIHAFYSTTDATVRELAETIRRARVESHVPIARDTLEPHAVLQAQGMDGAFGRTLREQIVAQVGASNLTRVTVLALAGRNNTWSFLSFAVKDGRLAPMELRHLPPQTTLQHLVSSGMGGHLEVAVTPASTAADTLEPGFRAGVSTDADTARALHSRALRIENPRIHDNGTLDCVSCHLAAGVRRFAERQPYSYDAGDAFTSSHSFTIDDEPFVDTSVVHMFSYRGRVALVSPRVVHETVATLERFP